MTVVIRIENAGPDLKARRLHLDDGDEVLVTSAAVVRALGLKQDAEVSRTGLVSDISRIESGCAHDRVLRLLGYRDRSIQEVSSRLRDDGYGAATVSAVVERFIELGFLDDASFAHRWAGSRRLAGYGPSRIERELRSKGIGPELAREAAESADPDELLDRAIRLIARFDVSTYDGRQKATARLLRKGYSSSVAAQAVERVGESPCA